MLQKRRSILLGLCLILVSFGCQKEEPQSQDLEYRLEEKKISLALLVRSKTIEAYPVWAENGETLYFNSSGTWYSVDFDTLKLAEGLWRSQPALVNTNNAYTKVDYLSIQHLIEQSHPETPLSFNLGEQLKVESSINNYGENQLYINDALFIQSKKDRYHSFTYNQQKGLLAFVSKNNGILLYQVKN